MGEGDINKQIAQTLGLKEKTVQHHNRVALQKTLGHQSHAGSDHRVAARTHPAGLARLRQVRHYAP